MRKRLHKCNVYKSNLFNGTWVVVCRTEGWILRTIDFKTAIQFAIQHYIGWLVKLDNE